MVRNLRFVLSTVLLALSSFWVGALYAATDYANLAYDGESAFPSAYTLSSKNTPTIGSSTYSAGGNAINLSNGGASDFSDGSALPTKRYMTFDIDEDCDITIEFYSGSTGRTLHIVDGDTKGSLASKSIDTKNSIHSLSYSFTGISSSKTIYLCGLNSSNLYITSITVAAAGGGGGCTARTLSFTPASLSPTKDVATALPVASASAGTGTITYTMDGSDVTSSIGSYTFTDETSHTYKASIAADATYCKADATMTITAAAAPLASQTISVATDVATAVANGLTTVTATASDYSGTGAITYTITKPDASEITNSTGTFTVDQVGDYKVKATIAADATYAEATSSVITVTGTACTTNTVTLTIDDESLDLDASETATLTAASATSGGAVTITGSAGITSVGGTFAPVSTGSYTVTGTVAASGSYCPGTTTRTITVTSALEPICATYTGKQTGKTTGTGSYGSVKMDGFTGFGYDFSSSTTSIDYGGVNCYKLGGDNQYAGITGTFKTGDVITVKAQSPGQGTFAIYADKAATTLIHAWTLGVDYTASTNGDYSYTIGSDGDDASSYSAIYVARVNDINNQNPHVGTITVSRCVVCPSGAPGLTVNTATATVAEGCTKDVDDNLTITNETSVTYTSDNTSVATVAADGTITGVSAGTANITIKVTNSSCSGVYVDGEVAVTVTAGASYTVDAEATVPNTSTPTTVTLTGSSLTNPVTVTVPAGLTVTYSGTPHAGATTFNISAAEANAGASLTVAGSAEGDYVLSYTTTTACGAVNKITNVGVRDLTALPCPVLTGATGIDFSSATVGWTPLADESNVANYSIQIYKGAVLKYSTSSNKATSSALIAGLDDGETYTYKVFANSTNEGVVLSSTGCAGQSFTTTERPIAAAEPCISEGFETLTAAGSSPADGAENLTEIRTGSSVSGTNTFILNSGVWTLSKYRGATDGSSYVHTGNVAVRLDKSGSGSGTDGGTLTMPAVDNPIQLTFYVNNLSSFGKSNMKEDIGLRIKVGSNILTSGIYVDDVEIPTLTREDAASVGSAYDNVDEDGNIKFGSGTGWHKVSVDITSTNLETIQLINRGGRTDMWFDDFTVTCSAQQLTVTPSVAGLDYVPDLGPSEAKPFVVTGTAMPLSGGSGTVVMTAATGSNFEVSTDGGVTFTQTSSYNIPYNTANFTKTLYVRLKEGLSEGSYSDNFTFTTAGYTKQSPTMTTRGSVTNMISTIACGVTERISFLSGQDVDGSGNPIYTDREGVGSWTATSATSGTTGINLATSSSLTSPNIYEAASVQLEKLSFYYQIASGGSNTLSYQVYDGPSLVKNGSFDSYTTKTAYHVEIDLSDVVITDYLKVAIVQGSKRAAEVWDVNITASGKKDISFSETSMELSTSQGCTSEPVMFRVFGTCLDDDSKIVLYSDVEGKYEFSADGSVWTADTVKYNYAGDYPTSGRTFYARVASTAPGGASVDEIHATNNYKGYSTAYISSNVTSSSSISPADGATINVTSTKLGEQIVVIPIEAGTLCNDLSVTTSCVGITLSDCYNGSFGSTVNYSAVDTTRAIYLKFTPGSVSSCDITMTSGASISSTFTVNFTANAVTSPGHFDVDMAGAKDLTSSKFEFSLADPAFETFQAKTSFEAGDLSNTTLFVRTKGGVAAGASETFTFGAKTVTITAE